MLRLTFKTADKDFSLELAQHGYKNIWDNDGQKILEKFTELTGLDFPSITIDIIIVSGTVNYSGTSREPMSLGAGYSGRGEKAAALTHELAHRLLGSNKVWVDPDAASAKYNEHRRIYLFLYDFWCDLYGKDYADQQVLIEKQDKEYYGKAWDSALELSREQRQQKIQRIIKYQRSLHR